ncbi:MAG: carbohydrate ABC transporter permease [Clostridia bacterium]|nr:carbohydrate ABC transporter permease [Clostridia bacterium]
MKKLRTILLTLLLAAVSVGFVFPMVVMLCSSFMSGEELSAIFSASKLRLIPYAATLSGYFDLLFASQTYISTFWNSLLLALAIMVTQTFFSLVAAFALAKFRFCGKRLILYLYVIMMMMPFQVTLLPNYLMARWMDIYNSWWALILPGAFQPFTVFLLYQFIRKSLPDSVVVATLLETSSPWVMLFRVVIPSVKPGVLAAAVLSFADAWNMVEQPMILLKDEWRYPLSLVLSNSSGNLSVSFAGAVLYVLPVVLVYFAVEDELIQGVSKMGV